VRAYAYPTGSFRAQCLRVVDGDTVDLLVDLGFHQLGQCRFRLLGVDAPEVRSASAVERAAAAESKAQLASWLCPTAVKEVANLGRWPLRIETAKDPDHFGRWLARVYWTEDETGAERCANEELVIVGLAEVRSRA